jgi:outer membrane protein
MKNIIKFYLLASIFVAYPIYAVQGIAIIDYQQAILETQTAKQAFKALREDPDYAADLETAQTLQAERITIAETIQKESETMSQEQIAEMNKEFQEKNTELEFVFGKLQRAEQELLQKLVTEMGPSVQKIVKELQNAKQISLLLARPTQGSQNPSSVLDYDPSLDITDDVTSMLDVAASEAASQSE